MDRRQPHVLAVVRRSTFLLGATLAGVGWVAPLSAADPVPGASPSPAASASPSPHSPPPSPKPSPTPHKPENPGSSPVAAPGPKATVTPAARPSPSPFLPGPVSQPRGIANLPGSNPRPWEWRSWNHQDHEEPEAPGKSAASADRVGAGGEVGEAEDSAAMQRVIEQLPPDERGVFLRNFRRWAQLTTEERQTLRRQATERRRRMEEEMDSALHESGLHLDNDRREIFMLRYGQERRKLERELQEKIAAERARRTPEIIQRLRREFEPVASPTVAGPTPLP